MQPDTRYARSGELFIAYQVAGDGPFDLVFTPGYASHLEIDWEWPPYARMLDRLSSFSRLILFDRRGTGLSDPVAAPATFEERMDDLRAVMDAVGSERAALLGWGEGGSLCQLFAATYPQRSSALILYASYAKGTPDGDYPWGLSPEVDRLFLQILQDRWGRDVVAAGTLAPSVSKDAQFRQWLVRLQRSMSPGLAIAWYRMTRAIDIRHVLPAIRVPTLILHRKGDRMVYIGASRFAAERIPGAKFVELEGFDHVPYAGDQDALLVEIQEFLTGIRPTPEPDRVLATVLFTDIVGSTERAAELGDRRWRELLEAYYLLARRHLVRFRGRELDTVGDGLYAAFDGPARAVHCAVAIRDDVRSLGLKVRAGAHTGECEVIGRKMGGIAVHTGARVAAIAGSDEVLVSSTVKDLVVGSTIEFEDRGLHSLKGVPGEWRLFAVSGRGGARS